MATPGDHRSSPRSPRIPPFDRNGPPRPPAGPRLNEQIRIPTIRLIGPEGEQHGIVPTPQAMEMAREAGMDLVEIAAQERPPVCKIMDWGKHKYAQSKKAHQKTHQQKIKELRVRPKTGVGDIETRVNQARGFLEHGDKVLLKVQFRGRELQHIEEGRRIVDGMLEQLADVCKVESPPRMEGKQMTALLAPKGTGPAKPKQEKPKQDKPKADKPAAAPAVPPPAATPSAPPAPKPAGPPKPAGTPPAG
jgi:translation initiation factor IF-3